MGETFKGSLYIVSTPIGNLADITYRALEVLRNVELIAAEDTRHTKKLLNHYEIRTRLSSYNSFNQIKKGSQFIDRMKEGKDLAVVSDAGTPGISDPLYHLVQSAIAEDINIHPIPGPTAAIAALTVSGLPMDRFIFEGFLPRKKGRMRTLENLAEQNRTIVLYESPYRVEKTLKDLFEIFGDRKVTIARELTKKYEEIIRGNLADLVSRSTERKWKGEVTMVIAGSPAKERVN